MSKHRWWHRFWTRVVDPGSQEHSSLEGWRLQPNQRYVRCERCKWYFIGRIE